MKYLLNFSAISSRMLIPTTELGRFDSMVMPFELEAYDILKSRSCKQKLIPEHHRQPKRRGDNVTTHEFSKSDQPVVFHLSAFSSPALSSRRNPSTPPHHSHPRYFSSASVSRQRLPHSRPQPSLLTLFCPFCNPLEM